MGEKLDNQYKVYLENKDGTIVEIKNCKEISYEINEEELREGIGNNFVREGIIEGSATLNVDYDRYGMLELMDLLGIIKWYQRIELWIRRKFKGE